MTSLSLAPPPRRNLVGEIRAVCEPARLLAALRDLPGPASIRRSIVTVPGLGAGDASMAPLRAFLRRIGHTPHGWGLGSNTGEVEQLLPALAEVVRWRSVQANSPIDLVGWSLGGVLAREVARDNPSTVRSVVTYGTPVVGGPRYTTAARLYSDDRLAEIGRNIDEREQTPILPPVTAIFSKNDGVVSWKACIDPFANDTEHVEVRSTHLGMGLDPDVWRTVATRLERNDGTG